MDRKELDTRLNKMWKQIFNDLKKMKYDENPLELRSYDGAKGFLFEAKASPLLGLNRIMITMTPVAGAPFADGVVYQPDNRCHPGHRRRNKCQNRRRHPGHHWRRGRCGLAGLDLWQSHSDYRHQ